MAGKIHFAFRPTIFVNELVTVGSQSISSFVMESTVVKLPVILLPSSSLLPLPPAVVQKEKYIYPSCGQQFHSEDTLLSPFFFAMMAGETHFAFRPTIFVDELVTVGSQSISSIVMKSTVVELPITFITVVVVAVANGRRARRKVHLSILWPTICYDFSFRQGRFAGNVCQSLRLAVWANVPWNVGNVQLIRNVGNVPDVSDVPNVHLIYICRYFADRQLFFLVVNTFIH